MKLHPNVVADVNGAALAVAENPSLGERKKGDLARQYVYKFRSQGQLYLLGYSLDDSVRLIYLEAEAIDQTLKDYVVTPQLARCF